MDIATLRTFLVLTIERNYTVTARRMAISQPAVSKQIAKLEKEFGPLFVKNGRRLELTAAAELLIPIARKITQQVENVKNEIEALVPKNELVINIGGDINYLQTNFQTIVNHLVKNKQKLHIHFNAIDNSRRILEQVAKGKIDIGLMAGSYEAKGIRKIELIQDAVVLAGRNEVVEKYQRGENVPLLVYEMKSAYHSTLDDFIREKNFENKDVIHVNNMGLMRFALKNGIGLGIVSLDIIRDELKEGTVQIIERADKSIFVRTSIAYRMDNPKLSIINEITRLIKDNYNQIKQ
ncbi:MULTISPECIES: LysR family transcriptional regulator [unclassified Enterococcus]|uniref:LysR family transcriptional regulator n=1 Tax=unclassified Enterococcus TaxID=2608891 RepID=UPI0015526F9A|nr:MULTISPECIES: LysR family transcriptional regulator [unclassified Enterococcus]MBS7577132.1 LysR family transcriptional regulator [Enterococcus sp. MMGLQ5-2]MBS7584421.1 LysR family transcriptional regulator [Enterococcus sp. MMGLQ5-1]NPD12276.1 LysR family transcriptional regulator [Enterococcus sp. MMGLQ5-1]NPD36966.1 LysR family transcriptional regulator [Enterococcus sp. MMGLQ5-2]